MKHFISNKKLREFGFLIGFGVPIVIGLILPSLFGHVFRIWTLWVGFIFLILGLLKPSLLLYPYKYWMIVGDFLGWINGKIILSLVFFFVLIPISFIMKIFKYDPLKINKKNDYSYRENLPNKKINLNRIF